MTTQYTMSKYVMKKLQRGPTLKLNFSVMKNKTDDTVIVTEHIKVDDLALVVMIFKGNNTNKDLHLGMKMKKTDQANNLTVPMTVATGNFEDKLFCSLDWVETQLTVKTFDSSLSVNTYSGYSNSNQEVLLYNFEIDITIHAMAPVPICSMVTNKQYEDTVFTDFKLAAPDGTVPVHKSVLAAHSDVLENMLQCEDWKELQEGVFNVPGVTMKTLQQLKSYIYLGKLPDDSMDLGLLLLIASRYLMDSLKEDCIAKVVKCVRPEDFAELIEFACENKIPDLMKVILFETPNDILNKAYKLDIVNRAGRRVRPPQAPGVKKREMGKLGKKQRKI